MGNNTSGPALTLCWKAVKKFIPEDKKKSIAKKLIKAFEEMDFHPMYEARDVWVAAGFKVEEDDD